ncbi:MAG: hypothetical protein DKT66_13740 [Candidatus Melainabacteria bacterium]|nr:MAG: hypothetical protein DKT66_13740 [Candidatus Melainabacteria bacterium]
MAEKDSNNSINIETSAEKRPDEFAEAANQVGEADPTAQADPAEPAGQADTAAQPNSSDPAAQANQPLLTFSTQAIEPWILPAQRAWATNSIIVINVLIFIAMVIDGGFTAIIRPDAELLVKWQLDWGPLTLDGEPWRLLTSTFIHIGFIHLACNMVVLSRIGTSCELLYGKTKYVIIYLLSGMAASVVSLMFHADNGSAGASGAICGLIGAYAGFIMLHQKEIEPRIFTQSMKQIAVYLAVCVVFGASMRADHAAHFGGVIAGLAIGAAMAPINNIDRTFRLRDALGVLALSLFIVGVFMLEQAGTFDRSGNLAISKASNAYHRDNDLRKAIELIESPEAAQNESAFANQIRASLYLEANQIKKAKPAVEKLLEEEPDDMTALQLAMEIAFIDRNYQKTVEITDKALEQDDSPERLAYFAFTNYLASRRLGVENSDEELKSIKQKLSDKSWAYKVASFLDGTMSESDFKEAAQDNDQKTETNFYTGMVNLFDGKRAEAKERFEWVIKNGPREFIEYHYAVRELQDLQ